MTNPFQPKPGQRPGTIVPGAKPAPRSSATGAAPQASNSGQVRHDARGNAIWDWVKATGRHAIDSTSRLLKKLETPELRMEETQDQELRIVPDGAPGGGYDPYNQTKKKRR